MQIQGILPFGPLLYQPKRLQLIKGNEPKNLPGCYGIYELLTGKWYIGSSINLRKRRYEHESPVPRQQIHNAIRDSSIEQFVYIPLCYIDIVINRHLLNETETDLIEKFNSLVPNGYNFYARKSDPDYWQLMNKGEEKRQASRQRAEFREGAKDWLNSPEAIEKRKKTFNEPTHKNQKIVNQRKAFSDPEFKKKHSSIMIEINARPNVQEKRAASVKASWDRRRQKFGPSGGNS